MEKTASPRRGIVVLALLLAAGVSATEAAAQERGRRGSEPGVELSLEARAQIRGYYEANPTPNVEALPPGIRRRLAEGKALPPGIAKKCLPSELRSRAAVPDGYDLVEVGLDVLLAPGGGRNRHDP